MNRFAFAIATCCGCGYFPWGPGTAGSLAAILAVAALHFGAHTGRPVLLLCALLLVYPAVWAATTVERASKREDPGFVVVDEVLGQWVTLLGAAVRDWRTLLAAFLLFRLFDIWKPWPVRWFETLPEGAGIVADDLAAGVYGAIILFAGRALNLY